MSHKDTLKKIFLFLFSHEGTRRYTKKIMEVDNER